VQRLRDHFFLRRASFESTDIDRDREDADAKVAVVQMNRDDGTLSDDIRSLKKDTDTVEEIAAGARGLEAGEVEFDEASKDVKAPGQLDEHVQRRKWNVKEEGDSRTNSERPQLPGHRHQVIVVHPDEIVYARMSGRGRREHAIDRFVGQPVTRFEAAKRRLVVEQGPDDLVGESVVEVFPLGLGQREGNESVPESFLRAGQNASGARELLVCCSGPPDPATVPVFETRT